MGLLDLQRTPPMFDIASMLEQANPAAQTPPPQPPGPQSGPSLDDIGPPQYAAPAPGQSGPARIGDPSPNQMTAPVAAKPLLPTAPHEATHMNFMQRFNNHLSNTLVGQDAPSGYEGVLSPDEIKSAKPGWIHSLIGPAEGALSPQHQWEANLNGVLQRKQIAPSMAQAARVQAVRDYVTKIPLPTAGDSESFKNYFQQVYAISAAGHDEETLKTLTPLMDKLSIPAPKGFSPQLFENKDTKDLKWVAPGEAVPPGYTKAASGGGDGSANQDLYKLPKPDADGRLYSYLKKGQPVPPGWVKQTEAAQMTIQGLVGDRFNERNVISGVKEFRTEIRPLATAATVLNQSLLTIKDARSNPDIRVRKALYTSAIANFIQAADPKAAVRWQLLNYFKENINASVADRLQLLKSRLIDGTLPPDVLDGMIKHLEKVRGLIGTEIEAKRSGWAARRPELADHLPTVDEYLPEDVGGAANGDAILAKFLKENPVKPKP